PPWAGCHRSGGGAMNRVEVVGFPVDIIDVAGLRAWLAASLQPDGPCRHLVTLNPEYVMQARRDPGFAVAIRAADLVVADGVGVSKAASMLLAAQGRSSRVERIPGVEIVETIARMPGARVFLLGAGPGVAARAASRLEERHPGAIVAGVWDGGTAEARDDDESLRRIREAAANVVLVAYGASGQVAWVVRNQRALGEAGVRLAIGVGGAFDFISGEVARAPEFVRRLGLEWLYRLVREPWRWRRQLVLPGFALLALREIAGARITARRS
ncbi:MAG TPA: WecB/TagA/CpsF family glycosyltransferase, partial [Thermomicrobiales bacterium]|nr:WecB/TagA/CpsF family glycosyltransferase [Thermomicrobiales bacterium]